MFSIFKIPFIFLYLLSINICFAEDCEKNVEKTPLYQAIKSCEENMFKSTLKSFSGNFINLNENLKCDHCYFGVKDKQLAELCRDPNGFVCKHQGQILDSKCKYTIFESAELEVSPSFMNLVCSSTKNTNTTKETRAALIKTQVYSKEKITALKALYEEIKNNYISMLENSKSLSPLKKKILISKIKNTRIALDPNDLNDVRYSDCHDISPGITSTAIFNDDSGPVHEIHICIGAMANIENLNRYSLIHMISHELSHSIDPCALESEANELKEGPNPFAFKNFYPQTIFCLRGGSGNIGCNNSVLNCNNDQARQEYCSFYYNGENVKKCFQQYSQERPSCPAGKPDPNYNHNNLADYEKNDPGKDQISESFSDFMAAENVSQFIKNAKSEDEKTDALLSIASGNSRLHGVCLKTNTPDPHPPGFIRTNRINMSSKSFRESIGCLSGPPKTLKANLTCPGI
jgi:hypothetical protein